MSGLFFFVCFAFFVCVVCFFFMIDAVTFDILYKFTLSLLRDTKNDAFAGITDCETAANFHLIIHSKKKKKVRK